jgi:hypothetical protein
MHQSAYMRWLVIVTNYFLKRLCWKIVLDTSKIVNHARRLDRCNWCMFSYCVLSLSEGHFVIEVCTSLANYILYLWGPMIYFSGHISDQRVFILLCGSEHTAIEIANNWRYYWCVWQNAWSSLRLIIQLSPFAQKTADVILWTSPLGQIWSKNVFNTQA